MPSVVKSVSFDAADALTLARFWAAVLGSDVDEDSTVGKAFVEAAGWGGPNIWFTRVPEPKTAKNRVPFDPRGPGCGGRRGRPAGTARRRRGAPLPGPRGHGGSGRQRVLRRARTHIAASQPAASPRVRRDDDPNVQIIHYRVASRHDADGCAAVHIGGDARIATLSSVHAG